MTILHARVDEKNSSFNEFKVHFQEIYMGNHKKILEKDGIYGKMEEKTLEKCMRGLGRKFEQIICSLGQKNAMQWARKSLGKNKTLPGSKSRRLDLPFPGAQTQSRRLDHPLPGACTQSRRLDQPNAGAWKPDSSNQF